MATTADALDRKAAAQLDIEIIPGTEVMKDVGNVKFAHAGGKESGSVLVPHPTNNPNDPLNWSRAWKYAAAMAQLLYLWTLVCGALSIAPMYPLLAARFHLDLSQLSLLTGATVLALGFANIVIVPLSNIFGRRPISIYLGIGAVLVNMWQALATSHESLLAGRTCYGLVAATSETIMVQVIADIFFLHERGFWMGVYFTFYFSGAFLGPIMSGNIAASHGWRSSFWLVTALTAFGTVLVIFAYPETKWRRQTLNHSNINATGEHDQTGEKGVDSEVSSHAGAGGASVYQGHPSKTQFSPVQKIDSRWLSYIVRDLTTPFIIFFNPIVFWAAMMLAGPADLLLMFNLTESPLFSSPLYGWNPGQVGYSNFAFFIGGLVGVATAGPFSDWYARRATIHNNGIREAEMRLPSLVPFVCFFIVSHIVGAVGYQRAWPWPAILVCGFGFSGFAVTSVPSIAIAYAVDCYKPVAGEIMVVATVAKNIIGFSFTYWIFQLAAKDGYVSIYMVQFAISMFPVVMTIPLYFFGKRLRTWTKNSFIHRRDALL